LVWLYGGTVGQSLRIRPLTCGCSCVLLSRASPSPFHVFHYGCVSNPSFALASHFQKSARSSHTNVVVPCSCSLDHSLACVCVRSLAPLPRHSHPNACSPQILNYRNWGANGDWRTCEGAPGAERRVHGHKTVWIGVCVCVCACM